MLHYYITFTSLGKCQLNIDLFFPWTSRQLDLPLQPEELPLPDYQKENSFSFGHTFHPQKLCTSFIHSLCLKIKYKIQYKQFIMQEFCSVVSIKKVYFLLFWKEEKKSQSQIVQGGASSYVFMTNSSCSGFDTFECDSFSQSKFTFWLSSNKEEKKNLSFLFTPLLIAININESGLCDNEIPPSLLKSRRDLPTNVSVTVCSSFETNIS